MSTYAEGIVAIRLAETVLVEQNTIIEQQKNNADSLRVTLAEATSSLTLLQTQFDAQSAEVVTLKAQIAVLEAKIIALTPVPVISIHEGDLTITATGTLLENVEVRGYLRIKAAGVTVRGCNIVGPKIPVYVMALVQCSSTGTIIEDMIIDAQTPSVYTDGIVGAGFILRRVIVTNVVDHVKITGNDVLIENCSLYGNFYSATTPWGSGDTHTDNVQIGKGNNIVIRETKLAGSRNACLMITQDNGPVSNVTVEHCDLSGGSFCVNFAEKAYGPIKGIHIIDNVFGMAFSGTKRGIISPLTTTGISEIARNTYPDGSAVTVARG